MKQWAKNLCLSWLLRLTDIPEGRDELIDNWLAQNWSHPGFRAYVRQRDMRFMKELAGGAGLSEKKRDDYIRMIGQRFELLALSLKCKKADREAEKRRKKSRK